MKKLIINNEEQLYSKLFLYKSFIYYDVEFQTTLQNEEVQNIIKALNIKNNSKRIEFIYDYSCNKIDQFYLNKDLCKFKENKCISNIAVGGNINGCCRNCIYQSENGCKTVNLSCKFFYCDKVKKENKIIKVKDIKILKLLSFRQRLILVDGFFASREEQLFDLEIGLIIFHIFRNVYREIRNSRKYKRHKK